MSLEESIKIVVEGCGAELYDILSIKENQNNILEFILHKKVGYL